MNLHRSDARAKCEALDAWAVCWEAILCLPKADLSEEALFTQAERLVRACGTRTRGAGIEWLKGELDEGQEFVAEQIAAEPLDPDWWRLRSVLDGARSGIESAMAASPGLAKGG